MMLLSQSPLRVIFTPEKRKRAADMILFKRKRERGKGEKASCHELLDSSTSLYGADGMCGPLRRNLPAAVGVDG
jgi:hypothetical protein